MRRTAAERAAHVRGRFERGIARGADAARVWAAASKPGVQIGSGVRLGPRVRVDVGRGGRLVIGDGVTVSADTELVVAEGAELRLGDHVFVGRLCVLASRRSISVGPRTMLAEMVSVRDHDHDPRTRPAEGKFVVTPLSIGADTWIAAKSSVLRRGNVGDGCVIGAHSVVNRPVPDFAFAAGAPATVRREGGQ